LIRAIVLFTLLVKSIEISNIEETYILKEKFYFIGIFCTNPLECSTVFKEAINSIRAGPDSLAYLWCLSKSVAAQ
jgi:hypothetical protein